MTTLDASEKRIFVNNHNTRVATVTLPSASERRKTRTMEGYSAYAKLKSGSLHVLEGVSEHSRENDKNPPWKSSIASPGISKEDIHPQLEDVYQRVMRKLQWKANYEEIGCPSLAEQLGLAEVLDVGKGKGKAENDLEGANHSVASTRSAQTLRKSSAFRRRQFGRDHTQSSPVTQEKNEIVDDTFFLSQQPCPKTLRLVLEVVKSTVTEKLHLAETGSLKNCLRFVFESRSLLDRLLKEIPSYSQFQGEGERLPTAMQMQDMFQEFRQNPLVLPSAHYAKGSENGRIVACVTEGMYNTSACASSPSIEQSMLASSPRHEPSAISSPIFGKHNTSNAMETPQLLSNDVRQKVALPNGVAITIPPSYGKSRRGRQAGDQYPKEFGSSLLHTHPQSLAMENSHVRVSTHSSLKDRSGNVFRPMGPSLGASVTTTVFEADAKAMSYTEEELIGKKQRDTQKISVGTLTETNNATIVSREEYDKLRAYAQELSVEIEELKKERLDLQQQLSEEREYTSQKRKVVQYLRETLYRECSLLRSQLSIAQQKKIHHQTLIKEQQGTSVMNVDTRSMVSVSVYDANRLPSLSTRLPINEVSSLTSSIDHTTAGGRRMNRVASGLAASRTNFSPEEHDDGAFSVADGGGFLSPISKRISVDITAIHSLLDLVLLAVENDQTLPTNVSKVKNANMTIIAHALKDDGHNIEMKLKKEFSEREKQAKHYFAINRAETASKIALKDHQIAQLRNFSNMHYLKDLWKEKCVTLRGELKHLRHSVQDDLNNMKRFVIAATDSVLSRVRVVDTTLGDHKSLYAIQLALRDVISSAQSLLLPMLTKEYGRGYHPWPLKLRNTIDPFAKIIKARHGEKLLVSVREEVNALSAIYLAVHNHMIGNQILLNIKKPMPGKALRMLCASLAMSNGATTDLWLKVRERYTEERALEQKIAQLNMSIISLMYSQRIMTERSAEAMYEAGMDPRLSGLPAHLAINAVAEKLRKVIAERSLLRKQRQENAREVYRLWKSKCIDVYEGYPAPTPPQRLVAVEMMATQRKASSSAHFAANGLQRGSQNFELSPEKRFQEFWTSVLSTSEGGRSSFQKLEVPTEALGAPSDVIPLHVEEEQEEEEKECS